MITFFFLKKKASSQLQHGSLNAKYLAEHVTLYYRISFLANLPNFMFPFPYAFDILWIRASFLWVWNFTTIFWHLKFDFQFSKHFFFPLNSHKSFFACFLHQNSEWCSANIALTKEDPHKGSRIFLEVILLLYFYSTMWK